MALRSQATAGIVILAAASVAFAADYPVKHTHLHGARPGRLTIDEQGIRFEEAKKQQHARVWAWNDLQEVTLAPDRLIVRTYRDEKWLAGRDEVQTFTGAGLDTVDPVLRVHLPRRYFPELARLEGSPATTLPAKRIEGRYGHSGELLFAADRFIFRSATPQGSHTWLFEEVENVSSSDPLQFTIASLGKEYSFQLKQPLPEALYNGLWRRFNVKEAH